MATRAEYQSKMMSECEEMHMRLLSIVVLVLIVVESRSVF